MERKVKTRRMPRAESRAAGGGKSSVAKAAATLLPGAAARWPGLECGVAGAPPQDGSYAFGLTFENVPVGVACVALDGRYLQANSALCNLLGYSEQELLALKFQEVTVAEDTLAGEDLRRQAISGKISVYTREKRYRCKNGEVRWCNVTVQLVRDESGAPQYFISVIDDISHRKDIESRFQATFNQAAVGIAHTTAEGAILEVNRKLCNILGYSAQELLRLTTRELTYPDDRDREDALRLELLAGARQFFRSEKRYLRKDGAIVWVNRTVTLARQALTGERYLIQVIEDISERKRTEERLERLTRARRVMAECNHALIHAADEAGMLQSMCRIVVEFGGYKMAWLGLATGDRKRPIYPAAHAGFGDDVPMTGATGWSADGRYQGFMSEVISKGGPHIARNILNDPAHARRRARAVQHGFQSSIALPLKSGEGILGALAIYGEEPDAFDADEIALLTELAEDVAFGIVSLRARIARRNAEAALTASERRFRDIFSQAAVGITRIDLNGILVEVNQKFCDMLGYTRDELIGKSVKDITHPDDYGEGSQYRARLTQRAMKSAAGEKRFVRKDGTIMWARRTMSSAYDECGNPQYVISVVEDITERKELERRFELTFDHAAVGMSLGDLDGRYLLANQRFADMLGYSREELKGKAVLDLVPAEDHADVGRLRQKLLSGKVDSVTDERRYIRRDGRMIWARRTLSLARDATGAPLYFIGVAEDITESKEREERYRTIFANAAVGITRVDLEGILVDANQKFCDMLGYARDEILGKAIKEITHPEDYREGAQFRSRIAHGAMKSAASEKRFVRKDGAIMWARRTISAVYDDAGNPQYLISVVEDITERKQGEEALQRKNALASLLESLAVAANEARDPEDAMMACLTRIREYTRWPVGHGVIFKGDITDADKQVSRWVMDEAERWRAFQRASEPFHYFAGRGGFIDSVVQSRQAAWVKDVAASGTFRRIQAARECGIKSGFAFPVVVGERIVAFLEFYSDMEADADESLLHVVNTIGAQLARVAERREAEDAVRASEERYRNLFEFAPLPLLVVEEATKKILAANRAAVEKYGYAPEEFLVMSILDLQVEDDRERVAQELSERDPLKPAFFERRHVTKSGETIFAEVTARPLVFHGRRSRMLLINDVTERRRAEEALRESEEQFHQLANNIPQVFWICDAQQKDMIYVSPAYERVTGRPIEPLQVNARRWLDAVHEEDRERVRRARAGAATRKYDEVFRVVRPDGTMRWVRDRAFPIHDAHGSVYRIAGIAEDITDLRESEERLLYLAHYDNLTSLPNRVLFYDRLKQVLSQARRNQWVVAVMFLDLDRFKNVNDTLGHGAGDLLLREVSERLAGCVRSGDTVGRLSGDEFAIVLSNLAGPDDASLVAQKMMATFARPFNLYGKEVFVSASIGITLFPADSYDQDALIQNADTAMYRAKELGRNGFRFYTPEMNARALEKLSLESSLRRALERQEFLLYYQPKASLASGEVIGVEALLRWRHPEFGLVSPTEFMPMLEETGLIVPIGEWVIRTACAQIKAWQRAGIKPVPVAVNLSARQIQGKALSATISRILEEENVGHDLLELEITESSLASNIEEAAETLDLLNSLGVRVAIDDFGTGYSSLSRLKRFPLDALKIDGSFVRDITTDADDAAITRAIITMAHSLGLAVIAEGVETAEQLAFLDANGCDQIQGYYFSNPLPAEDCTAFVSSGRRLQRPGQSACSQASDVSAA